MKKPKLIILDIDGVLTIPNGSNKGLYLPLTYTLKKLQNQKIICTINTGRSYYRIKQILLEHFQPNCPMIIKNGGRLTTWEDIDLVHNEIDSETLDQLAKIYI